jgi:uncharacterized protein with HEPN domain
LSKRDPDILLQHMLDAAIKASQAVIGKTRTDLEHDEILAMAVVKYVEIVGEAARQMPAEQQAHHPEISWHRMIGMRHRLIHAYSEIDYAVVWQTVTESLPALIVAIEQARSRG